MHTSPMTESSRKIADEKEILENIVLDQALRAESDTALLAFAQLATLRLNAKWASISLIDGTNQYILVEVTQSSRLRQDPHHSGGDEGFIFGRKTLARSLGLCGNALDILSKLESRAALHESGSPPPSPLIINDVMGDERFKHQPFVASHPSVRFFAAMPISTKSGFRIGTISVMDDRPRRGLIDDEIKFLGDIGPTIIEHLEMTRVSEAQRRSEKMIKGLGVFMDGGTNLYDWWLELGSNQPQAQDTIASEVEKGEELGGHANSLSQSHTTHPSSFLPERSNPSTTGQEGFDRSLAVTDKPLVSTPLECAVVPVAAIPGGDKTLHHQSVDSILEEQDPEAVPAEVPAESFTEARAGSPPPSRGQSSRTFSPEVEERFIPKRLKELFSRAGHIIQQSIEVDGTVFLDARVSSSRERSGSGTFTGTEGYSGNSASDSAGDSTSSGRASAVGGIAGQGPKAEPPKEKPLADISGGGEDPTCGLLGLATSERSSLHGDHTSSLISLTESFLQTLLHMYPQGHVFSGSEQGTHQKKEKRRPGKPSEQALMDILCKAFPNARSIAFVPLWDGNRGRFFAGSFMWSCRGTSRVLTRGGDLNYLAAFGNSIMAEVARLEVVGTDRAKSDFISSISHELRSPLHGILASAEILHDTTVDLFQRGMIDTIERCGRTLLDTIQHVLDFAKINNFTRARKHRGGREAAGKAGKRHDWRRSLSGVPSLSVNVDLSLLAEDVVDSVFAGHEFQGNSALFVTDESSGFPPEGLQRSSPRRPKTRGDLPSVGSKESINVILDIDWRPNWMFLTESGAMRRVLMNLFGNALKYTDKGWVKVSLQSTDIEPSPGKPRRSVVRISVSDTGRGIAQEYLHSDLFTPFTQENSLNPGTGLGLSIVLQIVRSLGGQICITSEQGVGTDVVVTLTMDQAPPGDPDHRALRGQQAIQRTRDKVKGLRIGLEGLDVPSPIRTRNRGHEQASEASSLLLRASVESAATGWFHMEVAAPSTWESSPPDILLVTELDSWQPIARARDIHSGHPGVQSAFPNVPIIVLCSHEELCQEYGQRMVNSGQYIRHEPVHFVSKPCGPHRLAEALVFCLGDAARPLPRQEGSPPGFPSEVENSPQSLFQRSPESYLPGMEESSRDSYFASMAMLPDIVAEPSAPPSAPTTANNPSGIERPKPKLLLVEDNEINLRLLSTFAKRSNFDYGTAMNGLEAVQAFRAAEKPYNIIILVDITMPVMDGMEAAREIRKLERVARPHRARVMIIALTGLGSAMSRKEAFDNGFDMFLTKPARLKDLRKILEDWEPDALKGGGGGVDNSVKD
ncbi:hypothetical protein B0T14DRAFT_482159 [Immersiella caudata]|uniref:histidine kinase n=1 Tax=Immersiella caudata TaxID=314043 RepID=A0AA40C1G3_9PEZI|nr:hypothetical protein B0T14DRAFT_482159 [Immersiella caudata]